jgi:hypothetical protein
MNVIESIDISVLVIAVAAVAALSMVVQAVVVRQRAVLASLTIDQRDPDTRLMQAGAMQLRMEPELNWAKYEDRPYAVIVLRMRGRSVAAAMRRLGTSIRAEENAYQLSDSAVAIGLWNCDEAGMLSAIERFVPPMEQDGGVLVEAGGAIFPFDAATSLELVRTASARVLPVDALREQWADGPPEPSRAFTMRSISLATAAIPGMAVAAVAMIVCWVVIGRYIHGTAEDVGFRLAASAAVGGAVATALMIVWNDRIRFQPRSVGMHRRFGLLSLLGATLVVGGGLAAGAYPGLVPTWAPPEFGVVVAAVSALMLPLAHGRVLARVEQPLVPITMIAVGVWLVLTTWNTAPGFALGGRVAAAIGIGMLAARILDRLSGIVWLCIAISVIDIWSVASSSGIANRILTRDDSTLAEQLMLPLPRMDGTPVALIGSVDLVFIALFLGIAHLWRLHVPRTLAWLWLMLIVGVLLPDLTPIGTPLLPLLCLGFVLANPRQLVRSLGRPQWRSRHAQHLPHGAETPE